MPHLIIEYSANVATTAGGPVDVQALVDALHEAALATDVAPLDALRTRATGRDAYAIGDRHSSNMFIAVMVRLGPGRTDDDIAGLIDALMATLVEFLGTAERTMMLSVEFQPIDPDRRINRNNLREVIAERNRHEDHRHADDGEQETT